VNEGRAVAFGPDARRAILVPGSTTVPTSATMSYFHLDINNVPLATTTQRTFLCTAPPLAIKQEMQAFLDSHGYRMR
jgi:hypothetical protein